MDVILWTLVSVQRDLYISIIKVDSLGACADLHVSQLHLA
jgi:hypothetical protein